MYALASGKYDAAGNIPCQDATQSRLGARKAGDFARA